jgi:hypothetical protein
VGVVVLHFGLLALMLIVLVALTIVGWLGRGPAKKEALQFTTPFGTDLQDHRVSV